jgi:hypothetical protein
MLPAEAQQVTNFEGRSHGTGGLAGSGDKLVLDNVVLTMEKAVNSKTLIKHFAGLLAVGVVSSFGSVTGVHAASAACVAVPQAALTLGAQGGTTGCNTIIDLRPGNVANITNPGNGASGSTNPFTLDGSDDTLVGVSNNTGGTVFSIQLSSSQPIFGFDANLSPLDQKYLPLGSPGAACVGAACYQGPGTTLIGATNNSGTVSFTGGLPNGATAYFALEGVLNGATFTAIPNTPLPAALPLFAGGLGVLGLLGWRRKRKAAALAA